MPSTGKVTTIYVVYIYILQYEDGIGSKLGWLTPIIVTTSLKVWVCSHDFSFSPRQHMDSRSQSSSNPSRNRNPRNSKYMIYAYAYKLIDTHTYIYTHIINK